MRLFMFYNINAFYSPLYYQTFFTGHRKQEKLSIFALGKLHWKRLQEGRFENFYLQVYTPVLLSSLHE